MKTGPGGLYCLSETNGIAALGGLQFNDSRFI